ncbi:MAG: rhodanese-like domain-containing protein [Pseudorhodobacter sp.]|nr:rhodanese-like domain-containing protein [Rhizobacter sp.]
MKSAQDLVNEAMRLVTTHSVESVRVRQSHADVVLVDLRDVRELEREGVIEGAVHAPRGMLEFWFDPTSPYHREVFSQDKEFVLFCAAGWRSALSARTLMEMGVPRVSHMAGGFNAWKAAGEPVAEKAAKAKT